MLAYIPYMDPMGWNMGSDHSWSYRVSKGDLIAEEMSTRDSTTEGIFFPKNIECITRKHLRILTDNIVTPPKPNRE